MAIAIRDRFAIQPELVRSGGGVFEIDVDGKRIFSKKEKGRFPEDDEVFPKIEALMRE